MNDHDYPHSMGGWLTGREVARQVGLRRILIEPFSPEQCNPNTYDYRLASNMKILGFNGTFNGKPCVDPRLPMSWEEVVIPEDGYLLEPERAYLGCSIEKFGSDFYAALITGKSSVGRLFVKNKSYGSQHTPPGFFGKIPLQITAKFPTLIFPGMRLGQIFWFELAEDLPC